MLQIILKKIEKIRKKVAKCVDSEEKIGSPIDFSASACRWQPFGRNDIEHPKTLSIARNTQYSLRNTNKRRRLTEIYLEFSRPFVLIFV